MLDFLLGSFWSPYLVGAGIGLLVCLSLILSDRAIGCSTAFARTSGMSEKFLGRNVNEKDYYIKFVPKIEWEWMLVLGLLLGSFLASLLSAEFSTVVVPSLWIESFGDSISLRLVAALIGGVFIGFGSRMAGGCTSGHGISGTIQLTIGSWLAFISFFVGGIGTAIILFRMIGGI